MAYAPRPGIPYEGTGPFLAAAIPEGSRYELENGHAFYCAPTGGDGSRGTAAGAEVLDTDPAVEEAGIDAGYTTGPQDLSAPDIAVGNVPDKPGWIAGVPSLAVEYAGSGQDEERLRQKIAHLLEQGTQWVWVVRLVGPRRVEVHARGGAMRIFGPGEELKAPGILKNAVPVEALYDRRTAHEVTLRNLLQRRGYEDLEAVREEGREEGLATALLAVLSARKLEVPEEVRAKILACRDHAMLDEWIRRAAMATSLRNVFGD
jgi:hypothetical protein